MKMTFRWYGSAIDPIPLKYVKQIPGMTGLMGLLDKPAGVDWPEDEFVALKRKSMTRAWKSRSSSPSTFMKTSRPVCPPATSISPTIFPPSACLRSMA